MSEHLEKAKDALVAARETPIESPAYADLLVIARVQAEIATADALGRIADAMSNPPLRRH